MFLYYHADNANPGVPEEIASNILQKKRLPTAPQTVLFRPVSFRHLFNHDGDKQYDYLEGRVVAVGVFGKKGIPLIVLDGGIQIGVVGLTSGEF